MIRRLRVAGLLVVLVPAGLVLVGLQMLALRFGWRLSHWIPVVFHRLACRLLRVRVAVRGEPVTGQAVLVVSNHTTWLDIVVLSTLQPMSFIAKSEVAGWPLFGTLARLQRTVFIDRSRRKGAAEANSEIAERLAGGDAIVLFAEGTTSDGGRVLPFRSSLLGAARDAIARAGHDGHVLVQPVTVAYPARGGLPVGYGDRPGIAWYGDMDLIPHLVGIIAGPPLDAVCVWGTPVPFDAGSDRKAVTRAVETEVRETFARERNGRTPEPPSAPSARIPVLTRAQTV